MSKEKSFEAYFAKLCDSYRMALIASNGFPDRLVVKGDKYFLIELKRLELGKRGDKMLRGLYKPTQIPWHLDYLVNKGGNSLYTLFKLKHSYGIVHESPEYCRAVLDGLKYKEMKYRFSYEEYKTLKELVDDTCRE